MKAFIALGLCSGFIATSAFAAGNCSAGELSLFQMTTSRFSSGEVTRTDMAVAIVNYAQAQYLCKEITKPIYCAKAGPQAELIVAGMLEESRVGQRTVADIAAAQKNLREIKASCQP